MRNLSPFRHVPPLVRGATTAFTTSYQPGMSSFSLAFQGLRGPVLRPERGGDVDFHSE